METHREELFQRILNNTNHAVFKNKILLLTNKQNHLFQKKIIIFSNLPV